jgi:hypothetical protein
MEVPSSLQSALRAAACIFSFWSPSAVHPQTGEVVEASGCKSVDLSSLSTQVHHIHSLSQPYAAYPLLSATMQHTVAHARSCRCVGRACSFRCAALLWQSHCCMLWRHLEGSEVRGHQGCSQVSCNLKWVLLRHLRSEHEGGLHTQRRPSMPATPHESPCRWLARAATPSANIMWPSARPSTSNKAAT